MQQLVVKVVVMQSMIRNCNKIMLMDMCCVISKYCTKFVFASQDPVAMHRQS